MRTSTAADTNPLMKPLSLPHQSPGNSNHRRSRLAGKLRAGAQQTMVSAIVGVSLRPGSQHRVRSVAPTRRTRSSRSDAHHSRWQVRWLARPIINLLTSLLTRWINGRHLRKPAEVARLNTPLQLLGGLQHCRRKPLEPDRIEVDQWDRLNGADPFSCVDSLLAATAIRHDLTLITRNIRDVRRTGVRYLNPFD